MNETIDEQQARIDRTIAKAMAGASSPAVKGDPLGLGIPWSVDPRSGFSDVHVGAANRGWYYRVTGGATISKIGLHVAAAGGNIGVAVYASSGAGRAAVPAARVASSGSVACPAAGYAEIALGSTVDVKNGEHWLYLWADSTTATFKGLVTSGSALTQGLAGFSDGATPAPSPAATMSIGNRQIALIGVA